jgi:3',5'-cyclic AMP phosphodiesterase CpdA
MDHALVEIMRKSAGRTPSSAVLFVLWLGLVTTGFLEQHAAGADPVYFAQITDTHLGESTNLIRTEKIIAAINKSTVPITFVVHTGDLFYNCIQQEEVLRSGLAALKKLKPPLYIVPGNHDLVATNLAACLEVYQKNFGPTHLTADQGGLKLVLFYSELLRENTTINGYDPMAWLADTLSTNAQTPVLLFVHAPFIQNAYPKAITEKWNELVTQSSVKAVIAGHVHGDCFDWVGNVPVFVAEPVADLMGRQAAYRVYCYDRGRVSYVTKYLD